ncbi:MAG: SRPBCC domain-containing protein [Rhizobacter sp.]|nr:SRPBCC domain-containing protein [Rhizobacter sp.]
MSPTPASADRLGDPLLLTRRFAAPRALVFVAFTQAEHLHHWMSPQGMTMSHCSVDLRPGGHFHYALSGPGGSTLWGKWTFREIIAPERLVVVVQFSDEAGGMSQNPFTPVWPATTLSTTTFADDGDGTLITLRWQPLNASDAEQQVFDSWHASMQMGWGGTFDHLDAHLAACVAAGRKG